MNEGLTMLQSRKARFLFEKAECNSIVAPAAEPYLSFFYNILVNRKKARVGWEPADHSKTKEILSRFRQGDLTAEDMRWLAPKLHTFLSAKGRLASSLPVDGRDTDIEIELTCDDESALLLTNLPWEATGLSSIPIPDAAIDLADWTLAHFAITRLISGKKPPPSLDSTRHRLRLLCCISNYEDERIKPFDPEEFYDMLALLFRQFPMIDARFARAVDYNPVASIIFSQIQEFRPHMFVFVGHGDSGPHTKSSPELRFEEWTKISRVAECLASTHRSVLTILICCDMVGQSAGPHAQSGALALIREGLPAVLAMQGKIKVGFAKAFLEHFIANLLIRNSVPTAAAAGRKAKKNELHAFLPAVFINREHPPGLIAEVLKEYEKKMLQLQQRIPKPTISFGRKLLESDFSNLLNKTGLVAVTGGYGSGRTHIVRKVVDAAISNPATPPLRPVFYFDFDRLESRRNSHEKIFDWLAGELIAFSEVLPEVQPIKGDTIGSAVTKIDLNKIVLILDNFPPSIKGRGAVFWSELFITAAGMKDSLIIAAGPPPRLLPADLKPFRVPFLNEDETRQYVEKFLSNRAKGWKRIHNKTGGTLLILDAFRLEVERNADAPLPTKLLNRRQESILKLYITRIQKMLSKQEFQTLCNLCWLPRMTTESLAIDFLDSTSVEPSIYALKEIGILHTLNIENQTWCYIPRDKAKALRRVYKPQVDSAAHRIIEQFKANLSGQDIMTAFRKIALQPGGLSLLACVQRAYLYERDMKKASAIASLADVGELESEELLDLYSMVMKYARKHSDVEMQVRAAELAQNLGRQDKAKHLIKPLERRKVTSYERAKILKTRAAILKDTRQHEALPEIKACYKEAISLARVYLAGKLKDSEASPDEWKRLLCSLLHNRMATLAFLEHVAVEQLNRNLEELAQLEGNSADFANTLCQVAEYEMKAPTESISWESVAEKLVRARVILKKAKKQDARYLTYCHYQYGQYLRRKPNPELESAVIEFQAADKAAQQAGEPRRQGLARLRWVDLQWRDLNNLPAQAALEQLEEVIPTLEPNRRDALSMRVLERSYTLCAEIVKALPTVYRAKYLLGACRAAAQPVLLAKVDRERLGQAFCRYLQYMQELNDSVGARDFIGGFAEVLRSRLEVEPVVGDPWAVLSELKQRYADEEG